MRKTVLTLSLVLIGFFLVLSFINRGGGYSAERDLYQLNLQYGEFVKDPKATPDAQIQVLLNGYQKFIAKYPDRKLTALAHTLRARVLTMSDDFDGGVEQMEEMMKAFEGNDKVVVQGLIELAQIYAFAKEKQSVLDTYKRLVEAYPLSKEGMQAPLVVARHFMESKDTAMAARAYVDAIEHYQSLIEKYPDSQVEFRSRVLLATSYVALRNWDKSLELFKSVLLKFANPDFWTRESSLKITRSINTISVFEMNDMNYPAAVYSEFIQKYPDHPFNPELSKMITLMGEYKKYHDEHLKAKEEAKSGSAAAPPKDIRMMPKTSPGSAGSLRDIVDESMIDLKQVVPETIPTEKVLP